MIRYLPLCPACRTEAKHTFYKACQGCQTRRAQAMAAFHAAKEADLPPPSVNEPTGG